jgi:hypothetical protein
MVKDKQKTTATTKEYGTGFTTSEYHKCTKGEKNETEIVKLFLQHLKNI